MDTKPGKKPSLVVVQSYYDRDPGPVKTRHQVTNESKEQNKHVTIKDHLPKREQDREVTSFVTRTAAPPPPPMPPDAVISKSSSSSSFDSCVAPACPTPDYDTSSLSSASSFVTRAAGPAPPTKTLTPNSISNVSIVSANSKSGSGNSKSSQPIASDLAIKNAKVIPNGSITKKTEMNVNKAIAIISKEGKPSQGSKEKKLASEGDRVEMISIESFTLNNPSSPKPKPPATYFSSNAAGTNVAPKKPKAVAVTIGEYQSGVDRRQPSRFDFLATPTADDKTLSADAGKQMGSLLQSELAQTLSRSNLRKQTESQINNSKRPPNDSSMAKGTVTICLNSQADSNQTKISKHPTSSAYSSCAQTYQTTSNNIPTQHLYSKTHISSSIKPSIKIAADKIAGTLANNRVMIRIPNNDNCNDNGKSSEGPGPLNGILKNVNGTSVTDLNNGKHRSIFQQKSISFGEITTVISDIPQSGT